MEIKDVKLVTHHELPDENGKLIPVAFPHFQMVTDDGTLHVPFDPMNKEYIAVREWYEKQKKPGFKFDFKNNKPV